MNSNLLDTTNIAKGWIFINLFHDNRTNPIYYCRLRKYLPHSTNNEWKEVSSSGTTMQFAFDNANELAKTAV